MKTAIYKVAYSLGGSTNYTYIEAPTGYRSAEKHIKKHPAFCSRYEYKTN